MEQYQAWQLASRLPYCIVTGDSETLLCEDVTPVIATCLAERGLTRSGEKTRMVHIEEGFDFLGQNIRTYHGKRLIHPAKQGVKKRLDTLRGILTCHPTAKPATVIRQINPLLRGWVNSHRHVCSKKVFGDIDVQLGQAVWHWAKRRHPNTSKTWSKARDWPSRGGKNGVFTGKEAHGQTIHLLKAAATPIQRHVTVQGHANPYDPAMKPTVSSDSPSSGLPGTMGTPTSQGFGSAKQGNVHRAVTPSPRTVGGMSTTKFRGLKVVPIRWTPDSYDTPIVTGSFTPGTR